MILRQTPSNRNSHLGHNMTAPARHRLNQFQSLLLALQELHTERRLDFPFPRRLSLLGEHESQFSPERLSTLSLSAPVWIRRFPGSLPSQSFTFYRVSQGRVTQPYEIGTLT